MEVGEANLVEVDPSEPNTDAASAESDVLWPGEPAICPAVIMLDARMELSCPATELAVESTDGKLRAPVSRRKVFTEDAGSVIVVVDAVVRTVT